MSVEDGELACEVGHKVAPDELARSTELRLAEALWMAIEALDTEAAAVRVPREALTPWRARRPAGVARRSRLRPWLTMILSPAG